MPPACVSGDFDIADPPGVTPQLLLIAECDIQAACSTLVRFAAQGPRKCAASHIWSSFQRIAVFTELLDATPVFVPSSVASKRTLTLVQACNCIEFTRQSILSRALAV
jgi:hypothetical protein